LAYFYRFGEMSEEIQTVGQALRLAVEHQQHGRLAEAARIHQGILAKHPNQPDALHLLGTIAVMTGQAEKGIDLIGRAIAINPLAAGYHNGMGIALATLGRNEEAIAAQRRAIELDPKQFNARHNLGSVLASSGRYDEAVESFRIAVQLKPDDANVRNGLGVALLLCKRLDEAIAEFEEVRRLSPNSSPVYMHLGTAYLECGMCDEAMACFDKALALEPPTAHRLSTKIFAMHYQPGVDSAAILKVARQWESLVMSALPRSPLPLANERTGERRLRVGYVSPDFRDHPVGRSILPLLEHHDRGEFEIFCYSSATREDSTTGKLRACDVVWRNIHRLSDDRAAEMIRGDGIDILVDLALHTVGHRLALFARKAAPVQMSYLGYCSTTGLSAMDCRVTDGFVDPAGIDLAVYSERTIRLPRNYLGYVAAGDAPDVSPSPVADSGVITFGCLNKFAKCSGAALDLWARILRVAPQSLLILHSIAGKHLDSVRERFERGGVSASRLEFVGKQDWAGYMRTYARIDIGLDPFPYNGGVTTCEAISMGVPVITLSGETGVGRVGRSILSNVGLPELIAETSDEYLRIAAGLAGDWDQLKRLRGELRGRLEGSPMMDGKQLTRDIEAAYRDGWRKFCAD
jgi:predicted O-linked N-acetylglucosamine transferase (SPINDLY family)